MVCRSSIRPGRASPPPTMEHHAFKLSLVLRVSHSLFLRSLPSCYSHLAQTAAIASPLAPIDLPQRWQKIVPSPDRFIFAALDHNHVSVYLLLFLITLDLLNIFTHIHQPIFILEGILSYVILESENEDFCCCDLLAPPPLSVVDLSFYCRSRSRRRSVL